MRRLGVKFDLILTSPYRRALETAFIVARQFRLGEAIQTTPMLTPEIPAENFVEELISKYGACRNVILVGHEPQLGAVISKLIYGNISSPPILKKGGLCKLQIMKLGSEKGSYSVMAAYTEASWWLWLDAIAASLVLYLKKMGISRPNAGRIPNGTYSLCLASC